MNDCYHNSIIVQSIIAMLYLFSMIDLLSQQHHTWSTYSQLQHVLQYVCNLCYEFIDISILQFTSHFTLPNLVCRGVIGACAKRGEVSPISFLFLHPHKKIKNKKNPEQQLSYPGLFIFLYPFV